MKNKQYNKWFILFIICLGGAVIYIFPYLQYTFYDSMMAMLGFSNTQMGNIMSVYGSLNLIAYFIGGIIADRFSSRKLLTFSLVVTGLTGFWFASAPSYTSMVVISVIWSFTTIFTYWPAAIKAVKLLGNSDEQGKLFGFREALNCFGTLIFASIALWLFNRMGENFQVVVVYYSIIYVVVGILTFIFLPETAVEKGEKTKLFEGIGYVLKQPSVWVIGFVIFFGYAIGTALGKLTPYLTAVYGMTATTAAIVGTISEYGVANVGAVTGGIVSDKLKSSTKCLRYCFLLMAVLLVVFVSIPGKPSLLLAAIVMGLSIKLIQTAVRGVYFVPLDEAKIPDKYVGTAAGVVSVIGFLPDAFLGTVYGNILDKMPGEAGYKCIFSSLIVFCAIGFVLTIVLTKMLKKNKAVEEQ